ncbi:hypothetical protein GA830_10490 [Mesorhizobium sp. NBSH29]|uniref:hypothetical protein n=1 Tax=Mesorhizobium sp. NBSH29 TaxID=2654249 RepID=UPI0018964AAA|nr:hypothetical protein [Mesorhizobium sp. NBSH29]QPC87122.1 hypothetical protein GA830_10490 [Mesorhizobium sp. NBSH29]
MRGTHTMSYVTDNSITYNGARYWFKWKCGFAGGTDYEIREPSGETYTASLQTIISEYWREGWSQDALAEIESRLGLLVRSVCDNAGQVRPETIDAFNAWLDREHAAMMAYMINQPERYGDADELRAEFPAPENVAAGHWASGGWTPVNAMARAILPAEMSKANG